MYQFGAAKKAATALGLDVLDTVGPALPDVVAARRDLLDAITELKVAADELERRALDQWPAERRFRLEVPGVGVFERNYRGTRYVWDDRQVGRLVVDAAMDRIDHPVDVIDVELGLAKIAYWRVEDLNRLRVPWKAHRTRIDGVPCLRPVSG